ncbi:hypothetical protein Lal_00046877 [Lupinus albus]|uniref:Uncharacterized protein n=1 Tax=Lupinus albus TaxID=3870 RepID=A0A6A4QWA4_LUPAL|nr:hypothetical protein Lalb_Chr02g0144921 [Lupinus albus]KAF1878211.1 hypothetical protein Lal_00046877 [Lupinus albus]
MKEVHNEQSKLKHYMLAPIRILKKVRQLYIKGVVDCAGGHGYSAASPSVHHISHLPKVKTNNSFNNLNGNEEGRELLRKVQIRNGGNEMRLVMNRQRERQPFLGYGSI